MNDYAISEYNVAVNTPSDINEHLPKLLELANECDTVTELGVRTAVSSRAFLASKAKVISYDIEKTEEADKLFSICKMLGKDCEYIADPVLGDSLKNEINPTDLLFIDTVHSYDQLSKELARHHSKAKKYIAFHDTHIFGYEFQPNMQMPVWQHFQNQGNHQKGLLHAIIEFMIEHPEWKWKYHSVRNNGLTVLERVDAPVVSTGASKKKILIAIPTAKYIESATFKSIYDLEVPEGYEVEFQTFYGYRVDQVRNLIVNWVEHNYDYLFAVDYDIVLPKNSLTKLLRHDKDIVSGMYIQRIPDAHILEIWNENGPLNVDDIEGKGLIPIHACGFGCVLVKKHVFQSIGYPQFEYHVALDHKNTFSEDHDFCRKAREKGFGIWADTSIKCDHIGSYVYTVKKR